MSTGPLRRATGTLGLLILVPIVVQLVTGAIPVEEAALRATVVAVVTVAVGHLVSSVMRRTLRRFETPQGAPSSPDAPTTVGAAAPGASVGSSDA